MNGVSIKGTTKSLEKNGSCSLLPPAGRCHSWDDWAFKAWPQSFPLVAKNDWTVFVSFQLLFFALYFSACLQITLNFRNCCGLGMTWECRQHHDLCGSPGLGLLEKPFVGAEFWFGLTVISQPGFLTSSAEVKVGLPLSSWIRRLFILPASRVLLIVVEAGTHKMSINCLTM